MTEDEISAAAVEMIGAFVVRMKTNQQRSDAAAACMLMSYNLMRAIEGDQFVLGWLESAMADVKTKPCPLAIVRPH